MSPKYVNLLDRTEPIGAAEPLCAPASDSGCAILEIRPSGEGETVTLTLLQGGEQVSVHLLVEQYADLRPREGSISEGEAEAILEAGHLCDAIRQGMRCLQYGDLSARRLTYKLSAKGVSREIAARAAEYLAEKGYIREESAAVSRAAQSVRKLWGPRRIREDLRANGFSPDAVEEAMESLAEVDFEENCAAVIRKKYRTLPDDRAARQKMTAALMRLGYDADIIRAAARRLADGDS